MKSILISAFACDPTQGSEPGNGWKWASGVAVRGYNVLLITTSRSKSKIEDAIHHMNLQDKLTVHYVDHSKFWARAYFWNFAFMYFAYWLWQRKIYTYVKEANLSNNISFIHHVTWGSLKVGSNLHKLKIPMLFGPVGGGQITPLKFKKYLGDDFFKEKLRNIFGKIIMLNNPLSIETLRRCQVLVTNTDTFNLVKNHAKFVPKLVFDASIPLWDDFEQHKLINTHFTLLWVGKINGFKGLRLILYSLIKLEKDVLSNLRLIIVGDGPDRNEIEKLVLKFKLESNVCFVGRLDHSEVRKYYSNADVFIYTSLRDSFPGQILEAQYFSLPVITLDLHGQAIMVNENNGIKCSVNNPDKTIIEIRDSILLYYNNTKIRLAHGANGREQALRQTWDKKIDSIVYEYYPKIV
jgi:glycosyltransferase involved in cell wall biosynthesis